MPINVQLICAIGKGKRNLSKTDRFARISAIENDVGHFVAAQRLGGLFAEHPAHGIQHIGLSATVRANDRGDAVVKVKNRFIGE